MKQLKAYKNQFRNTTVWQMWIHLKLYFKLFFAILYGQFTDENTYSYRILISSGSGIIGLSLFIFWNPRKVCQRTKLSKSLDFIGLLDWIFIFPVNFSGLYTVLIVTIWFFPLCFGIFPFSCVSFPPDSLEGDQSFFLYAITFLLWLNGCSLIHVLNQMENHRILNSKNL